MARKSVPARDRSRDEESLLLRSAESLGRLIGSLQRQLDVATGRLAGSKPHGNGRKTAAGSSRGVKAKSRATTRGIAREKSAARKGTKKR